MSALEIIHLRSSGEPRKLVEEWIEESVLRGGDEGALVTLYRCRGLETDLAVHIRRSGAARAPQPSPLGLRLASALRAYGLVEHTVWEESR